MILGAGAARAQTFVPDTLPRPRATVHADTTHARPAAVVPPDTIITLPSVTPAGQAAPDTLIESAAPAAPDTTAAARRQRATRAPEGGERREPQPVPTLDQPRFVMLRSLVLPGWGQFHNHAWIKGALVAVVDGVLRLQVVRDEHRLNDLNDEASRRQQGLNAAIADTAAAGAAYRDALAGGDPQAIADAQAALVQAGIRVRAASDLYNRAASLYNTLLDSSMSRRWLLGGVIVYSLLDAYVDAHFRTFKVDFQIDPALPGGPNKLGMRFGLRWLF